MTELVTRMPRRAPALLYLLPGLAIAAVYAPVLLELGRDWVRDPNYSHGFLVPVVSAVLLWQRRAELGALPARPSWWGLVGILGSLLLLVVGSAGAEVFTQRVSFVTLLASLVLFLSGWPRLRRSAFPDGSVPSHHRRGA